MKSNYKRIGDHIQLVDERNVDLSITTLLGLSITKQFIPSVANTIGTNMKNYKVIRKGQFACSIMQVRRDKKMPVALLKDMDEAIISQAYPVFEVKDNKELLPEYLMMWFTRPEFDRHAEFLAVGGVRGSLEWDDFCDMTLPVPSPAKQQAIVDEYQVITRRISILEQLNAKLEETAQAIYKHWFVDFEFPDEQGKPYKTSGGKMIWNEELDKEVPEGWEVKTLGSLTNKIGSGSTPRGGKAAYKEKGIPLIRSMNIHDLRFEYKDLAFIDEVQASKLDNVIVNAGDVLINITGASVARCSLVPQELAGGRVNQHVSIVRPKSKNLQIYILCHLLSSDSKQQLLGVSGSGSTREALTKGDLEEYELLSPKPRISSLFEFYLGSVINKLYNSIVEINELEKIQGILLGRVSIG